MWNMIGLSCTSGEALQRMANVFWHVIPTTSHTQALSGSVEDFPDHPGDDDVRRTIFLDAGLANDGFCTNRVVTAKYNVVTFLPIFLFEMFSRLAYLYFLLQVEWVGWMVCSMMDWVVIHVFMQTQEALFWHLE